LEGIVSIKVMTLVWDGFDASGSELLCMLALADWCDDFGGNLYPSMATIAEKIRLSEKQARRIVHKFEQDGWLEVVGCANGGAPGSSKRWKLNVKRIAELALKKPQKPAPTPPASVTPPVGVPDPSHGCPSTPPSGVPEGSHPREPIHQEPSLEPPVIHKKTPRKRSAPVLLVNCPFDVDVQTWSDWHMLRKAKNAPVTETVVKGARAEAEKAGMTFEAFLGIWCRRGSQGLEAAWLKPEERINGKPTAKPRVYHDISGMDYTKGVTDDGRF
jgi:hypothetical protein